MEISRKARAGLHGCRLILVRHAHTGMAGRFCGVSDPPLSETGRSQLRELTGKLKAYPVTHIFSSDLLRARQTAEPIAGALNLRVRFLPSLREIGFGLWEGLNWSEAVAQNEQYAQQWIESFPFLAAPGGEKFEDFRRRVQDSMQVIAKQAGSGCALVITHGGVIRVFLGDVLSMDARDFAGISCDYASARELRRDGDRWSGSASF
jgi:broad specificity phosphatase PhoE